MSRTTYQVTPSGEDWKVKRAGAQRTDRLFGNQGSWVRPSPAPQSTWRPEQESNL